MMCFSLLLTGLKIVPFPSYEKGNKVRKKEKLIYLFLQFARLKFKNKNSQDIHGVALNLK